jgi:hypothetical protein
MHPNTLIGTVFVSNDVGRRSGTQGESIDRKRGTGRLRAGDSTEISHVQRTAQLCTLLQDWYPDTVGTRGFDFFDGKAHHEKWLFY